MSPRVRKLVGGVGMLAFVLVYALVAMALADSRPVNEAPELVRTLLYVVLGLVWILPLMPLIVWMERGALRRR
jgi:predicted membrane channel-forming protein YqfA (hemolysin III family)